MENRIEVYEAMVEICDEIKKTNVGRKMMSPCYRGDCVLKKSTLDDWCSLCLDDLKVRLQQTIKSNRAIQEPVLVRTNSHRARERLFKLLGFVPKSFASFHIEGSWQEIPGDVWEKRKEEILKIKGVTKARVDVSKIRPCISLHPN